MGTLSLRALTGLLFPTILISTALAASPKTNQRFDQAAYLKNLKQMRPDLAKEACAQNLIVKSKYREKILKGEDIDSIRKSELTSEVKARDEQWADQFRAFYRRANRELASKLRSQGIDPTDETDERLAPALAAMEYYVTEFPNDSFVSFHIGPNGPYYDAGGIAYKVSFELAQVQDVDPDKFLAFVRALSASGFKGGVRLIFKPMSARFHFNNIVAHGRTRNDVVIAEKTATLYFGSKLIAMTRGADVQVTTETNKTTYDWNRFLCEQDLAKIPQYALDFIENRPARPVIAQKVERKPEPAADGTVSGMTTDAASTTAADPQPVIGIKPSGRRDPFARESK